MTSLIEALGGRAIGRVDYVSAERIVVLLESDAPQAVALNTGTPVGFPRINTYALIRSENGYIACIISSVRTARLPYAKRGATHQDFDIVDLPFPSRLMELVPIGTLKSTSMDGDIAFRIQRGVDTFPSVGDAVVLPNANQRRALVAGDAGNQGGRVLIGRCPTAEMAPVYADPDKLFGRHLAILGNTGSGKSCSVAGLIRWSLESARRHREKKRRDPMPNARFIVLDPNGEYSATFKDQEARIFRVEPDVGERHLQVPAWLWNGEEWTAFTGAAPGVQRPVLLQAIRRLRNTEGPPDAFETKVRVRVKQYRDQLDVAIQSGDHQRRGYREGVAAVLLNIKADFEGLNDDRSCGDESLRGILSDVSNSAGRIEMDARQQSNPGYHDPFSHMAIEEVIHCLEKVGDAVGIADRQGQLSEDTPYEFMVEQLPAYVEALAAAQAGRDMAPFIDSMNLRIKGILADGRLSSILRPATSPPISLGGWLKEYVGGDQAANGPIAVLDLSLVPSEVIHVVVSVLARMIFEAAQRYRRKEGHNLPTTLVLEEAHTFVHRDLSTESATPAGRACARIFEKIAREGVNSVSG